MISINVNPAASGAGLNLGKANEALQKSLSRLSSGRRIVNSSDDAGGLAVSMKMAAAQKRTEATAINLRNIQSYLDTQDGAFKIADKVLSRMSELTTLARDVTKNAGDLENYNKEFQNLQAQLISIGTEKFNGVALFSDGSNPNAFDSVATEGTTITVPTSEDGSQNTTVTQANFVQDPWVNMMINGFKVAEDVDGNTVYVPLVPPNSTVGYSNDPAVDSAKPFTIAAGTEVDVATSGVLLYGNSDEFVQVVQMALQQTADMRAQNGAEMSRVNFAQDLLNINAINLEAANSRIMDVDVASESSQLARFQILQQAGTAMLAQANTSQQSLVRLLQG
jgi:flagellin